MKETDIEILKRIEKVEKKLEMEFPLGWSCQQTKVWPGILSCLVMEGYVEVVFRSNSYTAYRMTDKGKFLVKAERAREERGTMAGPTHLPQDPLDESLATR